MIRRPPCATRTATLFPYTTLFRSDAVIIRAIVGMCRSLGIGTVAEMSEQEAQVRPLVELGVQYGQGYLFGHPGPVPQPPVPPRRLGKAVIKRQSFLRR